MPDLAQQLEAHKGCMTLMDLKETLGVSYDTVYKWVRECSLPATKIAGTYWIDPQLAARWWREHSTTLAKPPARSAKEVHVT